MLTIEINYVDFNGNAKQPLLFSKTFFKDNLKEFTKYTLNFQGKTSLNN